MEITELIDCCKQGDLESFEELYRRFSKKALGTAYIISGNRCIAEDIVQEAFVVCFKKINELKNPSLFNIWFYKLLVRIGWRLSSRNRKLETVQNDCYEQGLYEPAAQDPESSIDKSFSRLAAREAVKKLKPHFKTVIILHYFNEMSIKEISQVLGCREGTVKSRLFKARQLLQKDLMQNLQAEVQPMEFYGKEREANG